MAVTAFATGDPLTAKVWAKDWIDSSIDRSYFKSNGFIGEDPENSIIWQKNDLENQKGDTIYLGNVQELSNAGITGDNEAEGNEEELQTYDDSLVIDQVRNAIRLEGAMTIQRAATDLRKYLRNVLRNWMANKIDQDGFTALSSGPTRVFYGGTATAISGLTSSDKLTVTLIAKMKVNAEKVTPEIKPVTIDGARMWVLVGAPESCYDLKLSDTTFTGALQYAAERGKNNPLFKNNYWYWDGVVIHSHRHVSTADNYGSTGALHGAANLFLGAGAGAIGYAKQKIWKEKLFDYDNSPGVLCGSIYGWTKLVFNSEDHAVQVVKVYATEITEGT